MLPLPIKSIEIMAKGNTKASGIDKIVEHNGNLGLLITENIGVIDIDGTSGTNPSVKQDSKALLGKILKKEFSDAIKNPSEDSNPVKYFLFSGEIIKAQVFCACSPNSFCKSLIIVTKSV